MNRYKQQLERRSRGRPSQWDLSAAIIILLLAASATASQAANGAPPKVVKSEGGVSPNPVILSTSRTTNKLTVTWQSLARQGSTSNVVYTLQKCPALADTNGVWSPSGSATNATTLTTDITAGNGFVTVQQDTALSYEGAEVCSLCHVDTHDSWMNTLHAGAFDTLKAAKMDKNASCIPCHTVGYGTPNGFKDEATTPKLVGVQCENCHGPAGGHVRRLLKPNNEVDETRLPLITKAAEMCGGCHSDVHHPTYEEWATSVHGTTTIPAEEFADPTNGPPRMLTCGACHSAATRLALLGGVESMQLNGITDASKFSPTLPSTQEASTTGITCVACHDPHEKTPNGGQLRFPLASKVPYSYNTGTNFAANYNPDVQTCAQCHNMRGASWKGTSRPPHHSPQYNILIGNGGFEAGSTNVPQSAHMEIETQCARCHTHPHSPDAITEATPNFMGHDFNPTFKACAPCHDEVGGEILTEAVQANTKQQVAQIKGLLDQWALTKAPDALKAKYGVLAWEFTTIGQLSTPTAQSPTGPSTAEQATIPDTIKQSRYNLYLIDNDHSYGVHNGNYTRFLLQLARDQVNAALQ